MCGPSGKGVGVMPGRSMEQRQFHTAVKGEWDNGVQRAHACELVGSVLAALLLYRLGTPALPDDWPYRQARGSGGPVGSPTG